MIAIVMNDILVMNYPISFIPQRGIPKASIPWFVAYHPVKSGSKKKKNQKMGELLVIIPVSIP